MKTKIEKSQDTAWRDGGKCLSAAYVPRGNRQGFERQSEAALRRNFAPENYISPCFRWSWQPFIHLLYYAV